MKCGITLKSGNRQKIISCMTGVSRGVWTARAVNGMQLSTRNYYGRISHQSSTSKGDGQMNDSASTLGQVSAIMLGIHTASNVALDLGPKTSVDSEQEAKFYRGILQGIVDQAAKAERIYQDWENQ
jgi:hypothetical protein